MTEGNEGEEGGADRSAPELVPSTGARWYWAEDVDLAAGRVRLDAEETRHLRTVLRHRSGDPIEVIDGRGGRYTIELVPEPQARGRAGGRGFEGRILAVQPAVPAPVPLALAVPLIQWPRLETLVDGAVQVGVTRILLWRAERAALRPVLSPARLARLHRIARQATTQSLGVHATSVEGLLDLPAVLADLQSSSIWIAHGPLPGRSDPTPRLSSDDPGRPLALVIGPEGGLTDSEVSLGKGAGAQILGLGPRRLRTEVAALAGLVTLLAGSRDLLTSDRARSRRVDSREGEPI